jgi:hypothetical protein
MRRATSLLMLWVFLLSALVGAGGPFVLCRPAAGPAHVDGPLRRCRLHTWAPGGPSVRGACTDSTFACGTDGAISVPPDGPEATAPLPAIATFAACQVDPPWHRPPLQTTAFDTTHNDPLSQRRTVVLVI